MDLSTLEPLDLELVDQAADLLSKRQVPGRHEVAAALRTGSGRVYFGLHVEGSARRTTVCAEAVAMGAAFLAGDRHLETCVAVHFKPAEDVRILTPCGLCRELISDYAPDCWILNNRDEIAERVPVLELIPTKPERRW